LSPRCRAELGTPSGEPAAGAEQGRRPKALHFASPPSSAPPECRGPLRASAARRGRDAPLQRRARNPERETGCGRRAGAPAERRDLDAPLQRLAWNPEWGTSCGRRAGAPAGSAALRLAAKRWPPQVKGSAAGSGGAQRPCHPAAAPSSEPLAGNRLRAKNRGAGRKRRTSPRRQAVVPPSLVVRCGRWPRAKALSPCCSAELGTPSGEPAAGAEQGRRPKALHFASPPSSSPPESGGPLRAAAARRGLDYPLQRRARNPERETGCGRRAGAPAERRDLDAPLQRLARNP